MPSLWRVAHRGSTIMLPRDLIVFAVVIVGRRDAAEADIGCSLEVGVLHARGDGDLLGIRILDDVDPAHGRNAEIAQIVNAGIDELVRLRAGRRGNDVAAANRDDLLAKPIFALARHDEEQLVLYVVTVEGKSLLAWRNDVHRATQTIE